MIKSATSENIFEEEDLQISDGVNVGLQSFNRDKSHDPCASLRLKQRLNSFMFSNRNSNEQT